MRALATSGLSAALAAIVVFSIFGAGSQPLVVLGGLALAAAVFGWLVTHPEAAYRLPAAPSPRELPPSRPRAR